MRADGVVRLAVEGRRGIHTAFLRDLGRGGMFVHVVDPEPPGRRLEFALTLPGQRRPLRGVAEVSWVRAEYERPGYPPGMALRFVALEAAAVEALVRALPAGEEPAVALLPPPPPRVAMPAPVSHEADALTATTTEDEADAESDEERSPLASDAPVAFDAPDETTRQAMRETTYAGVRDRASTGAGSGSRRRWQDAAAGLAAIVGLLALAIVGAARWSGPVAREGDGRARATAGPHAAGANAVRRDGTSAAATASGAAAAPVTIVPVTPMAPVAAPPVRGTAPPPMIAAATRLRDVRWEATAAGDTRVVARFDGALDAQRVSVSRIGGDSPRAVVVVRDIVEAPRAGWEPATPLLRKVRPGRHASDGRSDLHLVLDLAPGSISIERSVDGSELSLLLSPRQR